MKQQIKKYDKPQREIDKTPMRNIIIVMSCMKVNITIDCEVNKIIKKTNKIGNRHENGAFDHLLAASNK